MAYRGADVNLLLRSCELSFVGLGDHEQLLDETFQARGLLAAAIKRPFAKLEERAVADETSRQPAAVG